MKTRRSIFSLGMAMILVLVLLSGCKNQKLPKFEDFEDHYTDSLPENAEDGLTLHAFNWTYNEIRENLPNIRDAGFKNVLTMPVQTPKSSGSAWWAFYQPLSFTIGERSYLGTKEELTALCSEAEQYGICILADIVVNHMANSDGVTMEADGTPVISPEIEDYEPLIYRNRNEDVDGIGVTFHHNTSARGSGAETQNYPYGALPDLNTSNPYVQERVRALLLECIDVGIDGFRFDAAKHVETSSDPDYPSDFWEQTLEPAKEYYHQKTGKDLYAYGEILNSPMARGLENYTKYMRITDDGFTAQFKNVFATKDPQKILNAILKTSDATQLIAWVESHDEYVTDSTHYSDVRIAKYWSVIATKKGLGGLYLARPTDDLTVGQIGSRAFESEYTAAVNHFHNRFYAADSYESASDTYYIVEKVAANDQGVLILNVGDVDTKKTVSVPVPHLEDGNYYDQLTGSRVVVSKHTAYVNFEENGMAVVTRSKKTEKPESSEEKSKPESKESEAQPAASADGRFEVRGLADEYLDGSYELYIWYWQPGKWSQDFEIKDGVMLVDTTGMEGFLLAVFEKGYQVTNVNEWDNNVLRQSIDIKGDALQQGYVDMSGF